jgi:hypothetical protein
MMISTNPFMLLSNALASIRRAWPHIDTAKAVVGITIGRVVEGMLCQDAHCADIDIIDWLRQDELGIWSSDLSMYCDCGIQAIGYAHPFFRRVAIPAAVAYNTLINHQGKIKEAAKAALKILTTSMRDGVLRKSMILFVTTIIKQMETVDEERRTRCKQDYEAPLKSGEWIVPTSTDIHEHRPTNTGELTGGV